MKTIRIALCDPGGLDGVGRETSHRWKRWMLTRYRRRVICCLFAGVVLASTSGCDHTSQPADDAGSILPLAVGNSWHYSRSRTGPDGIVVDTTTMYVTRRDTVRGVPGYSIPEPIIAPVTWDSFFMFDDLPGGLYYVTWAAVVPPQIPTRHLVLAYPTLRDQTNEFLGYTVTTESLHETVDVPAGSFDCVKYAIRSDSTLLGVIWAKPNVGFVRTWAKYGSLEYTHELRSYTLMSLAGQHP